MKRAPSKAAFRGIWRILHCCYRLKQLHNLIYFCFNTRNLVQKRPKPVKIVLWEGGDTTNRWQLPEKQHIAFPHFLGGMM